MLLCFLHYTDILLSYGNEIAGPKAFLDTDVNFLRKVVW